MAQNTDTHPNEAQGWDLQYLNNSTSIYLNQPGSYIWVICIVWPKAQQY